MKKNVPHPKISEYVLLIFPSTVYMKKWPDPIIRLHCSIAGITEPDALSEGTWLQLEMASRACHVAAALPDRLVVLVSQWPGKGMGREGTKRAF